MLLEADYGLTDAAFQSGESNGRFAGDDKLYVKFFKKPVQDMAKSVEEERPVFKEADYIEIRQPGNKTTVVCRPARDMDKQRFSAHWKKYVDRVESTVMEGTPLEEWPMITRSQVEELKFFNVFTVEQLASISDGNAQKFMGINILRQKAKEFLKKLKDDKSEDYIRRISELEARLAAVEGVEEEEEDEEELEA